MEVEATAAGSQAQPSVQADPLVLIVLGMAGTGKSTFVQVSD